MAVFVSRNESSDRPLATDGHCTAKYRGRPSQIMAMASPGLSMYAGFFVAHNSASCLHQSGAAVLAKGKQTTIWNLTDWLEEQVPRYGEMPNSAA